MKGKSSIFIQTRTAKYRQLQCLLAPYDLLPIYFRNDRRGLDLGMRIYILIPGWAAHLTLPAGIDPHGYSWCLSCGSCYLRRSVSHAISRDRDWIHGPEAGELLSCDPQFILLTWQEWGVLNYIKSTAINNTRNDKAKAMQFEKRALYKCKKPFKELLHKVIQAVYTAFVSYCVFKKLMKDIIIAALPTIISKMTPSWNCKHFRIYFHVSNSFLQINNIQSWQ